ncbi:hypothetical protein ACWDZ4_13110 [Streptomyces sp. NPDC003016]
MTGCPPALLWHQAGMAVLPPEAALLLGGQAWGAQLPPEATPRIVIGQVRESALLRKVGAGADEIVAQLGAVRAGTAPVRRPVAHRRASLVHQRREDRTAAARQR